MEQIPYEPDIEIKELMINQYGTEQCVAGHFYGPAVRDCFLIHYIHGGKGRFLAKGKEYRLSEGQGFLICPGIVTYYQADYIEPWEYSWVGFSGTEAEQYLDNVGLTLEHPTFTYDSNNDLSDCLLAMNSVNSIHKGSDLRLMGLLYIFLSLLTEETGKDKSHKINTGMNSLYVKKSLEYIERNYSRKMRISELAAYIGLDRSYLGGIFKKHTGSSIQNYLVNYRINKACDLMENHTLSIGDISRSVGYEDPLQFSRIFRKFKSVSPSKYRLGLGGGLK